MSTNFEVLTVLNAASRILAAKLLCMVSLFMVFGLSCWAMVSQTVITACIAGGFAVIVFLPVLWSGGKERNSD